MKLTICFLTIFSLTFFSCEVKKGPTTVLPAVVKSDSPIYLPKNRPAEESLLPKAKNIILMIGDGMGISQITAGLYTNGNKLNLERFPIVGLHKPDTKKGIIHKASSTGTTASTGRSKTYSGTGTIATTSDTLTPKTILEEAENHGLGTGLIASSSIVHLTPVNFISHQGDIRQQEDLAADFLKVDVDLFIGGGKKYFSQRINDGRDLYKELRNKGYLISDFSEKELLTVETGTSNKVIYFTADEEPLSAAKGRTYLPEASKFGVEFLNRNYPDGFFLMIKASQIDWAGHANQSDYLISEVLDFDQSIGEVLRFAEADKETLVIVTADHETGGFSIVLGSQMDSLVTGFTTTSHTETLIPVFAYGPGAELFGGIYKNSEIQDKMRRVFGFEAAEAIK